MIFLKLTTTQKQFDKVVNEAIIRHFNATFPRAIDPIKKRIAQEIKALFRTTDTYKALTTGVLVGEFGFEQGSSNRNIENVLLSITDTIRITFTPFRYRTTVYSGGIRISMLPSGLQDVLDFGGKFLTEKGQEIPWLKWLLTKGDEIIISNYEFVEKPGAGRSTQGYMMETKEFYRFWRVPPEYSGVKGNNWITRTLDDHESYLESMLVAIIEQEISKVI